MYIFFFHVKKQNKKKTTFSKISLEKKNIYDIMVLIFFYSALLEKSILQGASLSSIYNQMNCLYIFI